MTANVSIEVAKKEDALKLPPAALRFKPKGKGDEPKEKRQAGAPSPAAGREPGGKPGGRKEKGQQVYILKDNAPVAVPIKTGIAGSSSIELVESALKEGDEVIIEQIGGDSKKKAAAGGSPMGRPF
jgi:HlyD family secretion protein